MTALDLPSDRRSPLQRGRGDGIWRLGRRTQRGHGRRRLLVLALIAVSVALGVGIAVAGATAVATDDQHRLAAQLGPADLVLREAWVGATVADEWQTPILDESQQQWLDQHRTATDEEFLDRAGVVPPAQGQPVRALSMEEAADLLPEGSSVLRTVQSFPDGRTMVTDLDVTHPLAGRTVEVEARAAPLGRGEALASPAWLARAGADVGDRVEVPAVGTVEIVGTAVRPWARTEPLVVVVPGALDDAPDRTTELRVGLPEGVPRDAAAQQLRAALADRSEGVDGPLELPDVFTATDLRDDIDARLLAVAGIVTTGFSVTLAGLLAACAFAVGVRRRLRELGTIGAIGATPAQVGRLVRAEGLVLGVAGGVLGLVLALGLAATAVPVVERLGGTEVTLRLPLLAVVPPVFVGVLGAVFAAWWPARTASRIPVVAALAGRVPAGRLPGWVPVASGALAVLGVAMFAWAATMNLDNAGYAGAELPAMVAGLLATLGAAGLGLPVLALGGRVADRLPVTARLALRDAARRRARSGAAVAALVPVLALPVVGLVVSTAQPVGSLDAPWVQPPPSPHLVVHGPSVGLLGVPPSADALAAVARQAPVDGRRADLVALGPTGRAGWDAWVAWRDEATERVERFGEEEVLRVPALPVALATPEVLGMLGLPDDAVADGEALVLSRALMQPPPAAGQQLLLTDGPSLPLVDGEVAVTAAGTDVRAVVRDDGEGLPGAPVLVTRGTAEQLGLREVGRATIVGLERPVTWDELAQVSLGGEAEVEALPVVPFTQRRSGRLVLTGLAALAGLALVTAVAGMTAALAATESDGDLRRAVALGAPPGIRRAFHGIQAWWHAAIAGVLGAVLGTAVGLIGLDQVWQRPNPRVWPAIVLWSVLAPLAVGAIVGRSMRASRVGDARRRTT